jgi:hypothetical protein
MGCARQRWELRQQSLAARVLHQDPGLVGCYGDRRSHDWPRCLERRGSARGTWSWSRTTLRNTYPSRATRAASHATLDCGLGGRHDPLRCVDGAAELRVGTAEVRASSTRPSSTSADCDHKRGRPRTSLHTACSAAPNRRSPVSQPKTGHERGRGGRLAPRVTAYAVPNKEGPVPPARKAAGSSSILTEQDRRRGAAGRASFSQLSAQNRALARSMEAGSNRCLRQWIGRLGVQ